MTSMQTIEIDGEQCIVDTIDSALLALQHEFSLFKCDRLTVISPVLENSCYRGLYTIERRVYFETLASYCPLHDDYRVPGFPGQYVRDCAPGINEIIELMLRRLAAEHRFDHVIAFAYFCDRQARAAARTAAVAAADAAAYAAVRAAAEAAAARAAYVAEAEATADHVAATRAAESAIDAAEAAATAAAYAVRAEAAAARAAVRAEAAADACHAARLEQLKFLKKITRDAR